MMRQLALFLVLSAPAVALTACGSPTYEVKNPDYDLVDACVGSYVPGTLFVTWKFHIRQTVKADGTKVSLKEALAVDLVTQDDPAAAPKNNREAATKGEDYVTTGAFGNAITSVTVWVDTYVADHNVEGGVRTSSHQHVVHSAACP